MLKKNSRAFILLLVNLVIGVQEFRCATATIGWWALWPQHGAVRVLSLPDGKDPVSCTASELQSLLMAPSTETQDTRQYRKLSASGGKLKVLATLQNVSQEQAEATVDSYSSRRRKQEAIGLARRLNLDVASIEAWFFQVLKELEREPGA